MVKIRLFRTGANKQPSYRIVAIDSRRKRQGRALEILGTYEPRRGGAFSLRREALQRWLGRGARLSDTVRSLMVRPEPAEPPPPAEAPSAPEQ